jgi:hypothetical protein
VHIVVRGAGLASTSEYLIHRIEAAPERITVHPHTEITSLHGARHVETVTWSNRVTGESQTHPISNVFLMLGAVPNTEWLSNAVALDNKGSVRTGASADLDQPQRNHALTDPLATACPGIFAVGDVRSGSIKRVASGVGEGSVVVASVHTALANSRSAQPSTGCLGEQLWVLSDVLPDSQSWPPSYFLDVIGGPVVTTRAVQSRHRSDVLLKVGGQTYGLENLLNPGVMRDVGAGDRPVQCTRILRSQSIDIEAFRTRQLVDVPDALRRIAQNGGNHAGDVAGGDRRSPAGSKRQRQYVSFPQRRNCKQGEHRIV